MLGRHAEVLCYCCRYHVACSRAVKFVRDVDTTSEPDGYTQGIDTTVESILLAEVLGTAICSTVISGQR